jgi:hypothetical protein
MDWGPFYTSAEKATGKEFKENSETWLAESEAIV